MVLYNRYLAAMGLPHGPTEMPGGFTEWHDPRGSSGYGSFDYSLPRSFDQGGWLQPGFTLAYNGTGTPERVGGAVTLIQQFYGLDPNNDPYARRQVALAARDEILRRS